MGGRQKHMDMTRETHAHIRSRHGCKRRLGRMHCAALINSTTGFLCIRHLHSPFHLLSSVLVLKGSFMFCGTYGQTGPW
jgi:hypothetical protein